MARRGMILTSGMFVVLLAGMAAGGFVLSDQHQRLEANAQLIQAQQQKIARLQAQQQSASNLRSDIRQLEGRMGDIEQTVGQRLAGFSQGDLTSRIEEVESQVGVDSGYASPGVSLWEEIDRLDICINDILRGQTFRSYC